MGSILKSYDPSWVLIKGTADAYTTGNGTVAINGNSYAYYAYAMSRADVSQITVSPSATKNNYAREACVRLTPGIGGYCIGFGAVSNGNYQGCYLEKAGSYLGNGGCGLLPATIGHTLAISASGSGNVLLTIYVDGVQTGTVTDGFQVLAQSQSGFAVIGDGNTANSQVASWQDYQGTALPTVVAAVAAAPSFSCTAGTGTCYDNFGGSAKSLLTQYNASWTRAKGATDAVLTGANSIQLPGQSYAYYYYNLSTSDTSQISVSASSTKQAYTREACVRVQNNYGGYCVGFGGVVNGSYGGCYIEKGGQYLGNVNCGTPSATSAHTLALVASGALPVVLQVYVDGVPMRALTDIVGPLPKSHPGFALNGDGTATNSDTGAWRDYREVAVASTPTFSPAAGSYSGAQSVAMTATNAGAIIHFTTDGSNPTAISQVYTNPVKVGASATIKAVSMVVGQSTSPVATAAYNIVLPPAPSPAFTVPSPYAGIATLVGITSAAGGQIQYCIDQSNTCTPSLPYILPVPFAYTGYIRARTLLQGFSPSAISSWQGTWSTVHFNTTTCPAGTQYKAYAGCLLTATGGLPPYTYAWSSTNGDGITEGLTLNPITGAIAGTVYGQGTYNVSFSVTDGTNTTVSQTIALAMKADNTTAGCSLFPADSVWHMNIASLPVDTSPAGPIATVYQGSALHLVFGPNLGDGGIPFLRVPFNQPNAPVTTTAYQSYFTSGPFPQYAPVEDTQNNVYGDRHVSVIQTAGGGNHCKLWEMFQGTPTGTGWTDASNAYWDLESYDMLPQDTGSTDAAGLPIAPLLYTYDEVMGNCSAGAECGVVKHPGRLTLNHTLNYHVWPATAQSGTGVCIGGYQDDGHLISQSNPPTYCSNGTAMGEIQRLKSSTAIPAACTGHPQALVLITAMRNYGLMVVDNGTTGGVVATADARWNMDDLSCLTSFRLADFEPVNVSSKMLDINSSKVRQ